MRVIKNYLVDVHIVMFVMFWSSYFKLVTYSLDINFISSLLFHWLPLHYSHLAFANLQLIICTVSPQKAEHCVGFSHTAEQTPSVLHTQTYSIVIGRQSYSTRDCKTTYIYTSCRTRAWSATITSTSQSELIAETPTPIGEPAWPRPSRGQSINMRPVSSHQSVRAMLETSKHWVYKQLW
jgi:hypothetical protein